MVSNSDQSEAILKARSRIEEVAASGNLEEVLRATLDEAERITGSCIGFYHFLLADQATLGLQAWSTRTGRDFCKAVGQGLHYSLDQAGVWVDAVRERRPVIHNDYASLPHRKGMPEGHAELKRELVVPVFRGDRIVAILGVGNKPVDYDAKDVETVQRLADMAWDVAEHKRTQESLHFQAAALEHSLGAVALTDLEGRLRFVNPAFARLWGVEDQYGCLGSNLSDLWADPDAAKAILYRVTSEGRPLEGELKARRKDGVFFDVHFTVSLAKDAAGHPLGAVGTFLNISERKLAEAALRESEERFNAVFQLMPVVASIASLREGRFVAVNQHFLEITGYREDELLGHTSQELGIWVNPADRAYVVSMIEKGQPLHAFENQIRRKDGSIRWVSYSASRVVLGGTEYLLSGAVDITARKRAEEAVARQQDFDELTTRFLSRMVNDNGSTLHEVISHGLGEVAHFLGGDLALIAFFDEQRTAYSVTYDWCAPGVISPRQHLQKVPIGTSPWIEQQILAGHVVSLSRLDDAPPEAEASRKRWAAMGFRSFIQVPFRGRGDTVLGNVGVFALTHEIAWQEQDARRLSMLADAIANAVERKRAEDELVLKRDLLEGTSDSLFIIDPSSRRFLDVNETTCSQLGYTKAEIRTLHLEDVDPAFPIAEWPAHVEEVKASRGGLTLETWHRRKDGFQFPAEVRVRYLNLGGRAYMIASARDITERRRAEDALKRAAREWSAAMDASDDVIYLLDVERRVVRANKSFYRATRTSPEGAIGRHIADIIHPQGEAAPCPVCRAQEEKRDLQLIMEADHPNNPVAWPLEVTVKIVREEDDRPISILMTLHDLRAARKEMDDKATLERQLQQAGKMESVGRLAGGVAHDFNNMLGVIIGHSELVLEDLDPSHPHFDPLRQVHDAATRSAALTRQLLAFARKQTIAPKVLNLNEIVGSMLTMLKRLIGENISLDFRAEADIGTVKMDPSQIDQILANLCVNARDAIAGSGRITIRTGNSTLCEDDCVCRPGIAAGDYVRLEVSDDGSGMDKETLERIFEPFFTTKGVGQGTGLGLATVYGIVKQNHGHIDVTSQQGSGTTFTIYLPRNDGDANQAETKGATQTIPRGRENILLVEDEPALLDLTTTMLEKQGYTVLAARTPSDALRLAREHPGEIHLLVADVIMPEMSGRDVSERLRQRRPGIKTLYISGHTADVIARHGVLSGDVHFIHKPFSAKDLAAKVREALDGQ